LTLQIKNGRILTIQKATQYYRSNTPVKLKRVTPPPIINYPGLIVGFFGLSLASYLRYASHQYPYYIYLSKSNPNTTDTLFKSVMVSESRNLVFFYKKANVNTEGIALLKKAISDAIDIYVGQYGSLVKNKVETQCSCQKIIDAASGKDKITIQNYLTEKISNTCKLKCKPKKEIHGALQDATDGLLVFKLLSKFIFDEATGKHKKANKKAITNVKSSQNEKIQVRNDKLAFIQTNKVKFNKEIIAPKVTPKVGAQGDKKENNKKTEKKEKKTKYMACDPGPKGEYCRKKYAKKGYTIVPTVNPPDRTTMKGTLTGGDQMHVGVWGVSNNQ